MTTSTDEEPPPRSPTTQASKGHKIPTAKCARFQQTKPTARPNRPSTTPLPTQPPFNQATTEITQAHSTNPPSTGNPTSPKCPLEHAGENASRKSGTRLSAHRHRDQLGANASKASTARRPVHRRRNQLRGKAQQQYLNRKQHPGKTFTSKSLQRRQMYKTPRTHRRVRKRNSHRTETTNHQTNSQGTKPERQGTTTS